MNGTPSTTGQGQGFAQVLQPGFAAKTYFAQQEAEAEAAQKKAAQIERSRAEIQGKLKDLSGAKVWATRDGDEYRKAYMDKMGKYTGKWDLVAKGNTPEAEQFNQDVIDLGLLAQKSVESKANAEQWEKELFGEGADKYTDEDRRLFNEWVAAPLNFEQPKFLADFKLDLDKLYDANVAEPTLTHMEKNKQQYSGFTDDKTYSGLKMQTDPEVLKANETLFISNPKVISQISKDYAEAAKKDGYDDTVRWWLDQKKKSVEAKTSSYFEKPREGGKKVEFNEGNITNDNVFLEQGGNVFSGTTYQTEGVKANVPITESTYVIRGGRGEVIRAEKAFDIGNPQLTYSSPTLVYVDKTGKILPKGAKGGTPKVMVMGTGWVSTPEGEEKVSVYRPFEELKENFRQEGHDVDAIEQSLMSKVAPQTTTTKDLSGEYKDKSTGKIWIADKNGKFVKWK